MKTSIKYLYIYVCGIITGIMGILAWLYWQIYKDPIMPTEDEWEKEWKEFTDLPPGAGVDTYLDDVERLQMAIDINGNPYWYSEGRYNASDVSIADTQPIIIEPIAFFDRVLTDDEIKEYTRRYSKSLVDTQPIKIEDFYEPDASDFDKWEKESE